MVAAEARFEAGELTEIYLVSQRKYNLDPSCPWWQKAWFRYVFMPFVRFSFRRMKCAAPAALEPDGRIALIEEQGVYTDRQAAEAACQGEFWQVKPLPVDSPLPCETIQYKGHRYPQSVMPDRYRRRTFPLTAIPLFQLKRLQTYLDDINKKATSHRV